MFVEVKNIIFVFSARYGGGKSAQPFCISEKFIIFAPHLDIHRSLNCATH